MTFGLIDWVFLVIIAVFMLIALIRGFVKQIFDHAAWILGIVFAIFFYSKVAELFNGKIENIILCDILAFIAIFAATFIIIKLLGMIFHKIAQFELIRGIDRFLGAAFGVVEGFAIVCLIMFIMNIQPFADASGILEQSYFYGLMNKFIPQIKSMVANV